MPAVIGFVTQAFTTGILKGVLGRILISVALGAVQGLLAKARSDRAAAANRGIRGEVTLTGAKTPMGFVIGRYATGGRSVVAPYTFGTNNNYMTYVISLGCRRGGSLAKMIVNGEIVELAATSHATYGRNVTGKYANKMWVKFRDGSETTADSFLLSQFGSHPDRPWSSDMIGRDSVTVIVTFFYDDEVYPGGNVDVRFELTDIPFYDPRKDTTAGGSGSHRFSNPATWEPTQNPVVMIYNILRGIEIAGVGVWGGHSEADDFRFSEWSAAMTKSNTRYKAGYEVYLSDKPADIIDELLKACSGQVANVGGTWRISIGAPDAAVYYFSDDDLVVSENSQFDPFPGIDSTINTVVASYVNPLANWEVSEATTVTDAAYIASDDDRSLEADLALNTVFDDEQAQDLATTMLADSRRFRSHIHTLTLSAMFLEPLDTISWTSEYNGYVTKLFEVGQLSADVLGCIPSVTTRERDPDDYDFGGGIPYTPPVMTTTPVPTSVDGFTITGYVLSDGVRPRRPALRLAWEPTVMAFARAIRYQVRLTSAPATVTHEGAHSDPASGVVIVSEGILSNTSYQVRVKVVARGRSNPWSGWITVVSPNVGLGSVDMEDAFIQEIEDIAALAGVTPVSFLPLAGDKVDQIVLLVPPGRLYRWTGSVWTTDLFAGVEPGTLDIAAFASTIRPVELFAALPVTGNFDGRQAYRTTDKTSWRHNGTDWVNINAADQIVGQLIAGQIAAGAIGATEIAAGAIVARNLAVADFSNRVTDPLGLDLNNWKVNNPSANIALWTGSGATDQMTSGIAMYSIAGGYSQFMNRSSGTFTAPVRGSNGVFTVAPGETYFLKAKVHKSAAATVIQAYLGFWVANGVDASAAYPLVSVTWSAVQSGWLDIEGIITIPALVGGFPPALASIVGGMFNNATVTGVRVLFGSMQVRRANAGELTVDGSIKAHHLAVETLLTDSAQIGALIVNNGHLANATITTAKIGDGQITNAKIGGLAVDTANIASAAVTNAKIDNLAVTSAKIADLTVGTIKITNNAVTNGVAASKTSGSGSTSAIQSRNITITCVGSTPVSIWLKAKLTITGSSGTGELRAYWNGTLIYSDSETVANPPSGETKVIEADEMFSLTSVSGTNTLRIESEFSGAWSRVFGPAVMIELKK